MLDLVITGGTIVTATQTLRADLGIQDGRVAQIAPGLCGAKTIDATGRLIIPGGVDPHCHIEQKSGMGQWNADTFETATRSAAMGGTTTVVSFAAQSKGERLADVLADYSARATRGAAIDHAFHLFLSDITVPHFFDDLRGLIDAGHRSVKLFTTYDVALSDAEIIQVMTRASGALVCVHAENDALIAYERARLVAQGKTAPIYHAKSRPRLAEIEAVRRIIGFAEYFDQPVMLFHISTREAVADIRAAKARGVRIWSETCPHYLLMTEDVLNQPEAGKWMCSPPQRSIDDQEALWDGLADGTVDLVSSDHAPYRYDETGKLAAGPDAPFTKIGNGLPGLEPRLALMFDAMMRRGWSVQDFVRLTAKTASDLFGLGKGDLRVGGDADFVIWDPEHQVTYGANDLHDNVGYNPWHGHQVTGWPIATFLRGECVARDGAFLGGQGRWLDRRDIWR